MNISAGGSEGRVRLQGSLTLRDAKQVQGLLLDAISASREVEIDVSDVSSIDVSIIQLIVSARKSAEQRGRKLALATESNGAFRATLAKAGFLGDDGACRHVDEEFWTGGGLQKTGIGA
ncbi:STAS domain-containing protein [Bradyrhizobium manausense]|uniref:STAS domain-containing protein n=1 Tax=Bradyrhizobium manausense TaxID=989370 RepID=UPI001BA686CA|nr:STAS domain-containing protein [Bradyrhizobium manausense]MBR0830216.1 STAS domain-containing protein [Bradyrhizobium manausense]UVO31525.1 STAS domain-containing protein [Bradyrhizobium arachidis]